jgi:hypothetical protein
VPDNKLSLQSNQIVIKNGQVSREADSDCCCGGGLDCDIPPPDNCCERIDPISEPCAFCMDCTPAGMEVVVTGGDFAGTYELTFSVCDGYGVRWRGPNGITVSKGPGLCNYGINTCNEWRLEIDPSCFSTYGDFNFDPLGCGVAVPFMYATATPSGSTFCSGSPCGGDAAPSEYTVVVSGHSDCIDGTYVLPLNYCDGMMLRYRATWGGFTYTLEYYSGWAWFLTIDKYFFGSSLSGYNCFGPTGCGVSFDFNDAAVWQMGTPPYDVWIYPDACTGLPTIPCAYGGGPYQCPLCVGQGIAEPSSFKATFDFIGHCVNYCCAPITNDCSRFPVRLYSEKMWIYGSQPCMVNCSSCNEYNLSIKEWTWLVAEEDEVSLCFYTYDVFASGDPSYGDLNICNQYLSDASECDDQFQSYSYGGVCHYKSDVPVATVVLGVANEMGDCLTTNIFGACLDYNVGVNVYLHWFLFGNNMNVVPPGSPSAVWNSRAALIDDLGVIWGLTCYGQNHPDGCCHTCADSYSLCTKNGTPYMGYCEQSLLYNPWTSCNTSFCWPSIGFECTDPCYGSFPNAVPSPDWAVMKLTIEPCGTC